MPPPAVKTIREIIYYQYAKIISESSGFRKTNYGMVMSKWKTQKICEKENSVEKLSVYCVEGIEVSKYSVIKKC